MRERPILFSAPMVRALLADRKTQTRRIVKPVREISEALEWAPEQGHVSFPKEGYWAARVPSEYPGTWYTGQAKCPYGVPGDRLWVRETFAIESTAEYDTILDEGADSIPENARDGRPTRRHVINADEDGGEISAWYTVPRYRATEPDTLLMIKEADEPEDQMVWTPSIFMPRWASCITLEIADVRVQRLQEISEEDAVAEGCELVKTNCDGECGSTPCRISRDPFVRLWESINGEDSWDANPWVWALTFKRVQP